MYLLVCVVCVISLSLHVVGLQWFRSKGWGCSSAAVSEINDGALSFPLSISVWWLYVVCNRSVLGSVVWLSMLTESLLY